MPYHAFPVLNQQFLVPETYEFIRELGQGAYGVVCAADNKKTNTKVAIKKVCKLFERPILTKRALRELRLLQHFNGHKNITGLYDMDIVNFENFNELYLYQELMEADLHQIIRSGQSLSDAHYQSNLLVNADCDLKICDFGLARGYVDMPGADSGFMTEYVATRWYRAPEIMLSFQSYTKASE
ncbi:kinase-like domain-containing protein [Endogone sp. FLAS-F59071]|nr:kinase-like domain-containing protein [Endogone sp. FLAS-F59071]|eukprot:RUS15898.1 kinase-like domain-containing protein [Endogone sp. FLAS-F59071]